MTTFNEQIKGHDEFVSWIKRILRDRGYIVRSRGYEDDYPPRICKLIRYTQNSEICSYIKAKQDLEVVDPCCHDDVIMYIDPKTSFYNYPNIYIESFPWACNIERYVSEDKEYRVAGIRTAYFYYNNKRDVFKAFFADDPSITRSYDVIEEIRYRPNMNELPKEALSLIEQYFPNKGIFYDHETREEYSERMEGRKISGDCCNKISYKKLYLIPDGFWFI